MMMNINQIDIEQALFGYSSGHHLLASSRSIEPKMQKTLEIFTDLTGTEIKSGFEEYVSGYPMDDSYMICKTWYASEMSRPGCVWTHALFIKYSDIVKIKNVNQLINLFKRPNALERYTEYENTLQVSLESIKINNLSLSTENFKKLVYAIYDHSDNIILPANSSKDFEVEIFIFLIFQPLEFIKNFIFCTGSLSYRTINRKPLSFQIIPYSIMRSIRRTDEKITILSLNEDLYPLWVEDISDGIISGSSNFLRFLNIYNVNISNSALRLYFISVYENLTKNDIKFSLSEYLDAFIAEDQEKYEKYDILKLTIKDVFFNKSIKFIQYEDITNLILDLSTIFIPQYINTSDFISDIKIMVNLAFDKYAVSDITNVLKKMVHSNLNSFGEAYLISFAASITCNTLPIYTEMDMAICKSLLQGNAELLFCSKLWDQNESFQKEIIYSLEHNSLSNVEAFINLILDNSHFDLSKPIFDKFGNNTISVFLNWCSNNTNKISDRDFTWAKICEADQEQCLYWIPNLNNKQITIILLDLIRPQDVDFDKYNSDYWIMIYSKYDFMHMDNNEKRIVSSLYIKILLLSSDRYPQYIFDDVYKHIYNLLAEDLYTYDEWSRLLPILPEVPWYNSWDKCKQLRKAFENKKYIVNYSKNSNKKNSIFID